MTVSKKIIKICGITHLADAQMVDRFGPNFIGMILHPGSKRYVQPQALTEILSTPTFAQKVLVFGFDSLGYILEQYQKYKKFIDKNDGANKIYFQLPVLQSEFASIALTLQKYISLEQIIPAYNVSEKINEQNLSFLKDFPLILLDSAHSQNGVKLAGGAGIPFDWNNIADVHRPFLLAGGLNPDNIDTAMQNTHALGFDVAGGTEASPGIKDPIKVKKFIEAVYKCNS